MSNVYNSNYVQFIRCAMCILRSWW